MTALRPSAVRPGKLKLRAEAVRACQVCGCTDNDCRGCVARTGQPCFWVAADLCSACVEPGELDRAA